MISGLLMAGALAAAEPSVAAAGKRLPFQLTNDASFTASCTLVIIDDSLESVRLSPGQTYTRSIPLKRQLRLLCIKGRTREVPLSPGEAYRLVEVNGGLEIAPVAPAP